MVFNCHWALHAFISLPVIGQGSDAIAKNCELVPAHTRNEEWYGVCCGGGGREREREIKIVSINFMCVCVNYEHSFLCTFSKRRKNHNGNWLCPSAPKSSTWHKRNKRNRHNSAFFPFFFINSLWCARAQWLELRASAKRHLMYGFGYGFNSLLHFSVVCFARWPLSLGCYR